MRRDSNNIYSNEYIGVLLDTFYDRRNAYYFDVTPLGGRGDGQITNEKQYNGDLNPSGTCDAAASRADGRRIRDPVQIPPLPAGPLADLGLQRRAHDEMEERVVVSHAPADRDGSTGVLPDLGGSNHGRARGAAVEEPGAQAVRHLEPHHRRDGNAPHRQRPGGDAGFDLRYGVTQNLSAEFSYNTDFAQVEADEQQVNLTRFSLFFPEKREFFLENQGTFAFGGTATRSAGGGTPATRRFCSTAGGSD